MKEHRSAAEEQEKGATLPRYRILPPAEIDLYKKLLAELTETVASSDLRIEAPSLDFVVPTLDGELPTKKPILGLCWPSGRRVYVRHDELDDAKELVSIVAHELRHAQQFQHGRVTFNETRDERDARIYALEFVVLRLGDPRAENMFGCLYQARRKQINTVSAARAIALSN